MLAPPSLFVLSFIFCTPYFQVEINHAGEIDEIFDAISYRKGASVIRMIETYLGDQNFQVGPPPLRFPLVCVAC